MHGPAIFTISSIRRYEDGIDNFGNLSIAAAVFMPIVPASQIRCAPEAPLY
jgi:hypothetical protein